MVVAVAAVVEAGVQDYFGGSGRVMGHTRAAAAAMRGPGRDCACGADIYTMAAVHDSLTD